MELMQQGLEQGVPESHYFTQRPETESEESEGEPEEPPTQIVECPLSDEESSDDDDSTESERHARAADFLYAANQDTLEPIVEGGGAAVLHVRKGFLSKPLDCSGVLSRIKREEEDGFTPSPNALIDRSQTDNESSVKPNFAKDHRAEAVLEGRRQGEVVKEHAAKNSKITMSKYSQEICDELNLSNAQEEAAGLINRQAQLSHGAAYGEPTEPKENFQVPPSNVFVPANPPVRKIMENPYTKPLPKKRSASAPPPKNSNKKRVLPKEQEHTNPALPVRFVVHDTDSGEVVDSVPVLPDDDDEVAKYLAEKFSSKGISELKLSEEQRALINDCNRGSISAESIRSKARLKKRVEETIRQHGSEDMVRLLIGKKVPVKYNGMRVGEEFLDYPMYNILHGEKTPQKKTILNKVLTLCAVTWKNEAGPVNKRGAPHEPVTFEKYMKDVFSQYRDMGIRYEFKKDFNEKGEFHGVLIDLWNKWKKDHDKFATGDQQAHIDSGAHEMLLEKIQDGSFDLDDPEHLLWAVMYIFGRYCAFRGVDDHLKRKVSDLRKGVYSENDGPDLAGREWRGVQVERSKTMLLKLGKTKLPKNQEIVLSFIAEPESPFNPVEVVDKYVSHLHPLSDLLYAYPLDSPMDRAQALKDAKMDVMEHNAKCTREEDKIEIKDWDIWYKRTKQVGKVPSKDKKRMVKAPGNIGKNAIPAIFKKIAKLIGVKDFEKCTGHAYRALAITTMIANEVHPADIMVHARHSRMESSLPYARDNNRRKANRFAGLQTNGQLPDDPNAKKKKPNDVPPLEVQPIINVEPSSVGFVPVPRMERPRQEQPLLGPSEWLELQRYREMERHREMERMREENRLMRERVQLQQMLHRPPPMYSFGRHPPPMAPRAMRYSNSDRFTPPSRGGWVMPEDMGRYSMYGTPPDFEPTPPHGSRHGRPHGGSEEFGHGGGRW